MTNPWTRKELNYLLERYPTVSHPKEIAAKLNRSYSAIKTMATKLKLKRETTTSVPNTDSPKSIAYLKSNYLTTNVNQMAIALNRSETYVKGAMRRLGLIQPRELIERFARESRIQPGAIPPNKGKKWSEFMSEEAMQNSRKTQFKKGQLPHNTKTDFEISVRADKRGVNYKFIRVGLGKWIPLLRYNWEAANGPILKGFNLIHKDGDTMNCEASNGLLLSNADLMKKNTLHNYPKEIAHSIQLLGALTRQINKRKKAKA